MGYFKAFLVVKNYVKLLKQMKNPSYLLANAYCPKFYIVAISKTEHFQNRLRSQNFD